MFVILQKSTDVINTIVIISHINMFQQKNKSSTKLRVENCLIPGFICLDSCFWINLNLSGMQIHLKCWFRSGRKLFYFYFIFIFCFCFSLINVFSTMIDEMTKWCHGVGTKWYNYWKILEFSLIYKNLPNSYLKTHKWANSCINLCYVWRALGSYWRTQTSVKVLNKWGNMIQILYKIIMILSFTHNNNDHLYLLLLCLLFVFHAFPALSAFFPFSAHC